MHELAVTQDVLETALRVARREGAVRVTRVRLVLGDLSSFVDDSVRFYWEIVSKGTLCEGAELEFRRIPAKFSCRACGAEYSCPGEICPCPRCGSLDAKVTGGEEFHIESIDVETAEEEGLKDS